MSKRPPKYDQPEKSNQPVSETTVQKFAGPVWLIAILIGVFIASYFLHLRIFDDLETILKTEQREEFLSLLKHRAYKLIILVILAFVILVQVNILVKRRALNWPLNVMVWLLIFFYSAEYWFSQYPCSSGNSEALVAKIWFKKYWQRNYFGYRDRDFNLSQIKDKQLVLFLGDSYVAGGGIKEPEDRMSNILESSLGKDYFMINAGINGVGIKTAYDQVSQFPFKPAWVILAHVVNDIEEIIPQEDSYTNIYVNTRSDFSDWVFAHSRNSIVLDLAYHFIKSFSFGSSSMPDQDVPASKPKELYEWYKDSTTFLTHMETLKQMVDFVTDSLQTKCILLTFPEYDDYRIDSSDLYVNQQIIKHLNPNPNLYCFNTTNTFKLIGESARRVNMLDGHPSKKINRMVADSLYRIIREADKARP